MVWRGCIHFLRSGRLAYGYHVGAVAGKAGRRPSRDEQDIDSGRAVENPRVDKAWEERPRGVDSRVTAVEEQPYEWLLTMPQGMGWDGMGDALQAGIFLDLPAKGEGLVRR